MKKNIKLEDIEKENAELLSEKERKQLQRALKKVTACKGNCKECSKLHIYTSARGMNIYYCYGCDELPDYYLSDTIKDLKKEAIAMINFELS